MPKRTENILFRFLLALLTVFAIAAAFIIGIYQLGWINSLNPRFLQLFSLPVALVNGHIVTFSEVYDRLKLYEKFAKLTGKEELLKQRETILEKLVEDKIVEDLVRKRGIVISDQKLERYYRYLLSRFEVAPENSAKEIQEKFGVSETKFKSTMVLPDLQRAELQIFLLRKAVRSQDYELPKNIQEQAVSGSDFIKLARAYSQDEDSKYIGGDLGFVTREQLSPWLSDIAFDLEIGKVSEVVISPKGYHILQVSAKDEGSNPPRIDVRQILIKGRPLEEFLRENSKNYRVYVFDKL